MMCCSHSQHWWTTPCEWRPSTAWETSCCSWGRLVSCLPLPPSACSGLRYVCQMVSSPLISIMIFLCCSFSKLFYVCSSLLELFFYAADGKKLVVHVSLSFSCKCFIFILMPHSVIIFGLRFAFFTHISGKKRTVSKHVR